MEKAEREYLIKHLADSRERLLDAVTGLNQRQQRFQPGPHRWSVAHCVEHVTIVERAVLKQMHAMLLAEPQPRAAALDDHVILARVPNRSIRHAAQPEFLPGKRATDFETLLRNFEAARERSLRFVAVTQRALRGCFFAHPELGELDSHQWILFLGAHAERHAAQVEEIVADPNFPGLADSALA